MVPTSLVLFAPSLSSLSWYFHTYSQAFDTDVAIIMCLKARRRNQIPLCKAEMLRLIISVLSLTSAISFYAVVSYKLPSDAACVELLYPDSPANGAVEYHWKNFLREYIPYAIYRGPPMPEREAAWEAVTSLTVVDLSVDHKESEGKLAVLGVALHMHCLKILRQHLYEDVEQEFFIPPTRELADQCIEVLRQHLVCTCDPTLYLQANTHTDHGTGPILGNAHYCRDFEKIQAWSRDNYVIGGGEIVNPIVFSG